MSELLPTPKEQDVFAKPPCAVEPGAATRPDTLPTLGENQRSSAEVEVTARNRTPVLEESASDPCPGTVHSEESTECLEGLGSSRPEADTWIWAQALGPTGFPLRERSPEAPVETQSPAGDQGV